MKEAKAIGTGDVGAVQTGSEALAHAGCRFYGMNGMFGGLVPTGGNQCALIVNAYSPCQMEIAGEIPNETTCPLRAQLAALLNSPANAGGTDLRFRGERDRMMGAGEMLY